MSVTITQISSPTSAKMSTNGQSSSSAGGVVVTVKEERHDEAEIAELAAKMQEAHKLQTAKTVAAQQLAAANRQQSAAANFSATSNTAAANGTSASSSNHHATTITSNGNQTSIMNFLTRKPTTSNVPTIAASSSGASESGSKSRAAPMSPNGSPGDPDDKKACDEESQKGHFGWATFGKIHIPYILRQSEKYCAVRMVEMKLLNKYLNYLHQDIYSCTCVRSYYITEAESRLLNEINHKHCDSQFGREMFSQKDLVVRLSDANKFYQFLDICYKKLLMGSTGPSDKCGFIRINKESVVPYTVRDTEKFVPLFYFEGETDNLKLKADYLSGWDLSYLKFCCKVQGIRNELFASDSVAVISLIDIKSYFPTGTEFEDYWPSKVVDTQLLVGTKSNNSSVNWTRQPSQPPPKSTAVAAAPIPSSVVKANPQTRKTNPAYSANPSAAAVAAVAMQQQQQQQQSAAISHQNQRSLLAHQQSSLAVAAAAAGITPGMNPSNITAAVQALANAGWGSGLPLPQSSLSLSQAQTEQVLRLAQFQMSIQQQAQLQQQQSVAAAAAQQQQHQRNNYAARNSQQQQQQQQQQFAANLTRAQQLQFQSSYSNMTAAAQAQQQQQPPPPLVRSAAQSQAHLSNAAASSLRQQLHHQQQLQQQNQRRHDQSSISQMAGSHQQRGSAGHPVDASGRSLNVIPDPPSNGGNSVPYRVQKVMIDNIMVPCINMKAYANSELLMTLPDLNEHFFPEITLDTCKRFLNALRLEMYKGNRQQVQTLRENGHHNAENIPLVQVRDVMTYMPQLTYMVRAQQQEQPPSKRSRMS